jgi:hypothetical protein
MEDLTHSGQQSTKFFSKKFALTHYDWLGFDLGLSRLVIISVTIFSDHTLIRYRLPELHALVYSCVIKYLIEFEKYPAQLNQVQFVFNSSNNLSIVSLKSRFYKKGINLRPRTWKHFEAK